MVYLQMTLLVLEQVQSYSFEMDHYGSDHPHPRPTDPIGIQTAITAVTTNTITINVGKSELNFYDVSDATYAADTGVLVLTMVHIHYYPEEVLN